MDQRKTIYYVPTSIPHIQGKIMLDKHKTKLVGYLVFDDSKEPIDHIEKIRKSIIIHFEEELSIKIAALTRRLEEAYWKKHRQKNGEDSQEVGIFSRAYYGIPDKTQISGNWGESTIHATHTYLTRNVLPKLDEFGSDITQDDLDQIQLDLFKKTNANGKSFHNQITEDNYYTRMERINQILMMLHKLSDTPIPLVQFAIPKTSRKRNHKEKIKSLPLARFLAVVCILLTQVMTQPLALACAIMVFAGLRTGEAAAVRFGDIHISENKRYATLLVSHRINEKGVRTSSLKTPQAYRLVVLPYIFVILYRIRLRYLRAQGYGDAEISNMLISGLEGSTANTLSAYCKKVLLKAGLTDQDMLDARKQMLEDSNIADNRSRDVEAYILRRDWATRAANCGMSYVDQDYYLGHKNDDIDATAYLDPKKQMETALLLERCVIYPRYSLHPAYLPVELSGEESTTIPATDAAVIKHTGTKPVKYKVTIKCAEPGDPMNIVLPRKPSQHKSSAVDDPVDTRRSRPILGVFVMPANREDVSVGALQENG